MQYPRLAKGLRLRPVPERKALAAAGVSAVSGFGPRAELRYPE